MRHNDFDRRFDFKVVDILEALRKNREKHIEEFQKARQVFLKAVARALELKVQKIHKLDLDNPKTQVPQNLLSFSIQPPANRVKQYDEMIDLFERTTDDVVTLAFAEHRQIFLDEWPWRQEALFLNATYLSGPTGPTGSLGDPDCSSCDEAAYPRDLMRNNSTASLDTDLRQALDELLDRD